MPDWISENARKNVSRCARKYVRQNVRLYGQLECQNICIYIYMPIYAMYTSRWYVRNYVRKVCQGGDHEESFFSCGCPLCRPPMDQFPPITLPKRCNTIHSQQCTPGPSTKSTYLRIVRGFPEVPSSKLQTFAPETARNHRTLGPRAVDEVPLFRIIGGSFCNGCATWATLVQVEGFEGQFHWSQEVSAWHLMIHDYKTIQNASKR